jgi:hypothetical protein
MLIHEFIGQPDDPVAYISLTVRRRYPDWHVILDPQRHLQQNSEELKKILS